jgi:hypothetical protein
MSAQSLPQQLVRDLRRNPKKAGLLALLAGVALWFWAPLFTSWFKSGEGASADAEQPTAAVVTPVLASPGGAKVAEAAKVAETAAQTWQQLVRWMDQDPRRKADQLPLERNPFAPHKPPTKPVSEPAKIAKPLPDNPQKLGLKLTGTLLGPGKRMALINGRAYAEGQTVKASADISFVVRQVEERKVTLERQGEVLVLQAVKTRESEPSAISRKEP